MSPTCCLRCCAQPWGQVRFVHAPVLFRPYLTLSRLRCSYDRTGAPGCRAGVRDDVTAVTTPPGLTVWACWGIAIGSSATLF